MRAGRHANRPRVADVVVDRFSHKVVVEYLHPLVRAVGQIERGYERIDERLNALGAAITRVPVAGGPAFALARVAVRRRTAALAVGGRSIGGGA